MLLRRVLLLTALLVLSTASLQADTFVLTATGPGVSVFATLTATPSGTPGVYYATAISGTVDSQVITGLIPTSSPGTITTVGIWIFDNVLYFPPSPTYFDIWGLAFTLDSGNTANLYGMDDGTYGYLEKTPGVPCCRWAYPLEVTVVPTETVPEPASVLLLGSGLLGLTAKLRRKLRT